MSLPTKRKVPGREQWELDFGKDLTGKRRRKYYPSEAAVDKELAEIKKQRKSHGEYWAGMTELERAAVVVVLQQIKARGLTAEHVWSDWQRWALEAAKQETSKPMAYDLVVEEWKRRKAEAKKSTRYVERSADVLLRFGEGRLKQPIHEVLPDHLETWLDTQAKVNAWTASTKRTYMLLFSSLWETAIKKGWASLNITDRLEPITVAGPDVKIYNNQTVLHLLASIMDDELTQVVLAPVILCLQGCMRPEEVSSDKSKAEGLPAEKFFNWADIDLKHGRVTVRPEVAKKGDQRTIKLQPAPLEWLRLAKKIGCELPPVNERRLVDAACALIGLDDWIRDGLRKCCATHLRVVMKNDYDVVKLMGNSVRVMLKHYADLKITEEESLEFWGITLEKVEEFRKSKEWETVKRLAAESRAKKLKPSASESETPAHSA